MMDHEKENRLGLLAEVARVQIQNAKTAIKINSWSKNEDPVNSKGLRDLCVKQMEASLLNLERVNEELMKLV